VTEGLGLGVADISAVAVGLGSWVAVVVGAIEALAAAVGVGGNVNVTDGDRSGRSGVLEGLGSSVGV
jgi:hypothetical protein